MSVYLLAWIASIMYGVETLLAKVMSRHSISNPWLLNFLWYFFVLIGTTILALYFGVGVPDSWTYIVFASFSYAAACTFYTLSIYKLDVSVISPIFSFRTALAVLAGALLLGEILTSAQYILILIIFVAGMFVSVDEKFTIKSFFNKKIGLVFLCMIAVVLMAVFIKKAVAVTNFWDTTLWMAFLAQVWMCATIPLFKKDISNVTPRQYWSIAAIAAAGVIATLAANAAYAQSVSIAAVIISLPLSMIAAFLVSRFAPELLEKHTLKVYAIRFAAAAVMIVAAINL